MSWHVMLFFMYCLTKLLKWAPIIWAELFSRHVIDMSLSCHCHVMSFFMYCLTKLLKWAPIIWPGLEPLNQILCGRIFLIFPGLVLINQIISKIPSNLGKILRFLKMCFIKNSRENPQNFVLLVGPKNDRYFFLIFQVKIQKNFGENLVDRN